MACLTIWTYPCRPRGWLDAQTPSGPSTGLGTIAGAISVAYSNVPSSYLDILISLISLITSIPDRIAKQRLCCVHKDEILSSCFGSRLSLPSRFLASIPVGCKAPSALLVRTIGLHSITPKPSILPSLPAPSRRGRVS